ncbi:hypothetical protein QQZ08_012566, partial [Neonectria magnoliae]
MLRHLSWDTILWVTGTPLAGSLKDILSPLTLMWEAYGIDWDPSSSLGWLAGLYRDDYDPYQLENVFEKETTAGIFARSEEDEDDEPDEGIKALKAAYDQDGSRLWVVSPDLLRATARQLDWGTNLGRHAVRGIFRTMHIRRTMRTAVQLDDGTLVYPSEGILPAIISVEEVAYRETNP